MSIDHFANLRVAQLIDANLDRAREGLRVIEDWCRYGQNQKDIVVTLKDWRQQLGRLHLNHYKQARSTSNDSGIGLNHPAQANRNSPEQVVAANFARVQEALRVLEEFTRTTDPKLAKTSAQIRYDLYELELTVLRTNIGNKRRHKLNDCNLCLITTSKPNMHTIVTKALQAGVKMVQYRSKEDCDKQKLMEAEILVSLCRKYEALFIVNDRIDFALAVGADGVHLGQDDLPSEIARKLIGSDRLLGRSTHCINELYKAEEEGCDYLGVGPIYSTTTKPDTKPVGLNYLREASKSTYLPFFAIGGINRSSLEDVRNAGAKRIAVVGAIMNAKYPEKASSELLAALK